MPFKNDGIHIQEYVWDQAVDGGTTAGGAIDLSAKSGVSSLPDGAIVKKVSAHVLTAVDSAADGASFDVGPSSDEDGYLDGVAEADVDTAGKNAVSGSVPGALLWDDTNDHGLYFTANASNKRDFKFTPLGEDITSGKIVFLVEYMLPKESA